MDANTFVTAYAAINIYAKKLDASSAVTNTAKQTYRRAVESKHFEDENDNQSALIVCYIFIAYRQNGVGRSMHRIPILENIRKQDVGHIFKELEDSLRNQSSNTTISNADFTIETFHTAASTPTKAGAWHTRNAAQPGTIADKDFPPVGDLYRFT